MNFALNAIKPYFKDRSKCGIEGGSCKNITSDGKMCVFGQYLIDPTNPKYNIAAYQALSNYGEEILRPEARNQLTPNEWDALQKIHDTLAVTSNISDLKIKIFNLGKFTFEDLENDN